MDMYLLNRNKKVLKLRETDILRETTKLLKPSVVQAIFITLALLGPIGWQIYSILICDYHRILLLAVLSNLSSVLITLNWVSFFKERQLYKEALKQNYK